METPPPHWCLCAVLGLTSSPSTRSVSAAVAMLGAGELTRRGSKHQSWAELFWGETSLSVALVGEGVRQDSGVGGRGYQFMTVCPTSCRCPVLFQPPKIQQRAK